MENYKSSFEIDAEGYDIPPETWTKSNLTEWLSNGNWAFTLDLLNHIKMTEIKTLKEENEKLKEENKALKQYMDNWRETMKTVNEGTSEITANLYGILDGHYKLQ